MIEGRATLGRRLLWTYCVLTLIFLCAPIVIVVIVSFNATEFIQFPPQTWSLRWYRNYFGARQWVEPTLLSLRIAAVTMVLATVLGTAAAIGLARGRFRGRRALEFFFVSPMVVPSIVLAIGLYLLFARFKLVGQPLLGVEHEGGGVFQRAGKGPGQVRRRFAAGALRSGSSCRDIGDRTKLHAGVGVDPFGCSDRPVEQVGGEIWVVLVDDTGGFHEQVADLARG